MKQLLAIGLSIWASASLAGVNVIAWSDLADPEAQVFDDPYRDLSMEQLAMLVDVARLREAGTRDEVQKLSELEDLLQQDGIDIDWLISQRWVVAEHRERAAAAGNAALEGAEVTLSGFAISAPPDVDGTPTVYLVEQRGLCSHMPPPNPNQMIRVRMKDDWQPDYIHHPVRLSGTLAIQPSEHVFRVVDGPVAMKATWEMTAGTATAWNPMNSQAEASSDWLDALRRKYAAQAASQDD